MSQELIEIVNDVNAAAEYAAARSALSAVTDIALHHCVVDQLEKLSKAGAKFDLELAVQLACHDKDMQKAQSLRDYINAHFDSISHFARHNGFQRTQVNRWLSEGFIVYENALFSKRRDLEDFTREDDLSD